MYAADERRNVLPAVIAASVGRWFGGSQQRTELFKKGDQQQRQRYFHPSTVWTDPAYFAETLSVYADESDFGGSVFKGRKWSVWYCGIWRSIAASDL